MAASACTAIFIFAGHAQPIIIAVSALKVIIGQ